MVRRGAPAPYPYVGPGTDLYSISRIGGAAQSGRRSRAARRRRWRRRASVPAWPPSPSSTAPGTVPGAGSGLIPELQARGHEAVAMDLPIDQPGSGLADYAKVVEAAVPDGDTILVGHSLGATVIPLVAAARAVQRLVFVCPVLRRPGRSLAEQADLDADVTTLGPRQRARLLRGRVVGVAAGGGHRGLLPGLRRGDRVLGGLPPAAPVLGLLGRAESADCLAGRPNIRP